jgi:hypothetical protein
LNGAVAISPSESILEVGGIFADSDPYAARIISGFPQFAKIADMSRSDSEMPAGDLLFTVLNRYSRRFFQAMRTDCFLEVFDANRQGRAR